MDEQLRDAKRIVMASPADVEAWEKYRAEFGRQGGSPHEWLDEIVNCSWMPIKERLIEGWQLLEKPPNAPFYTFDDELAMWGGYEGHGEFAPSMQVDNIIWVPELKPILILKPEGLFNYQGKKVSHIQNAGSLSEDVTEYAIPGSEKEIPKSYVFNAHATLDRLLNVFRENCFAEDPVFEAFRVKHHNLVTEVNKHLKGIARQFRLEIQRQVKDIQLPNMGVVVFNEKLKCFSEYAGHIENRSALQIIGVSSDDSETQDFLLSEGVYEMCLISCDRRLIDGRIARLTETRANLPRDYRKKAWEGIKCIYHADKVLDQIQDYANRQSD